VSTFASVHGLRLAAAAWNSGYNPSLARRRVACRSVRLRDSLTALAKAYRKLVVGERDGNVLRLAGLPIHGGRPT